MGVPGGTCEWCECVESAGDGGCGCGVPNVAGLTVGGVFRMAGEPGPSDWCGEGARCDADEPGRFGTMYCGRLETGAGLACVGVAGVGVGG